MNISHSVTIHQEEEWSIIVDSLFHCCEPAIIEIQTVTVPQGNTLADLALAQEDKILVLLFLCVTLCVTLHTNYYLKWWIGNNRKLVDHANVGFVLIFGWYSLVISIHGSSIGTSVSVKISARVDQNGIPGYNVTITNGDHFLTDDGQKQGANCNETKSSLFLSKSSLLKIFFCSENLQLNPWFLCVAT